MNPTTLHLPHRAEKPRRTGLTMVIDGGIPLLQFADTITSAAEYVDFVKFGWGTAVVTGDIDTKINVLREHFTIIQVCSRDTVGPFLYGIAVRRIDVAHGHDLVRAHLVGSIEQVAHSAAGSDDSYADSIVCTEHSG